MANTSKKTGDESVGARILDRRESLDMSRTDLARGIGASSALIAQIETGWRMPSYKKQLLIAKALGMQFDDLFGDSASEKDGGSADQSSLSAMPATLNEAVDGAAAILRTLPASCRLDALLKLQRVVIEEIVENERRHIDSRRRLSDWITNLAPNEVFVFGSNAAGLHEGSAARTAYEKFGAVWGEGHGHHGQSYAINTMNTLRALKREVQEFLVYAKDHPELRFLVTPIGTGMAGYKPDQIAPLFAEAPTNVILPMEFKISRLMDCFRKLFGTQGKEFSPTHRPGRWGIHDGRAGVQWNLAIFPEDRVARLGVNLEGLEYDRWPIANFILNAQKAPSIHELIEELTDPDNIKVRFVRDAWRDKSDASRLTIRKEHLTGHTDISISEMAETSEMGKTWKETLDEARGCLDMDGNHCRGRGKKTVTIIPSEAQREMEVSPHLTIWVSIDLDKDPTSELEHAKEQLNPVHEWVSRKATG